MQKTIATLLIICMMFSLVPPQTGMFDGVYENVFAGGVVGNSGNLISVPGSSNGSGGYIDGTGDDPTFRVCLTRNEKMTVNWDENSETYQELVKNMGFQYAPFSKGQDVIYDTLFFVPYFASAPGDGSSYTHNFFKVGNSVNGGYAYYSGNPTQGMAKLTGYSIQTLMVARQNQKSKPANVFKDKVVAAYNAKTITSTTDLSNFGWNKTEYLPTRAQAEALLSYILQAEAGMKDRVLAVTDENFNKSIENLNNDEQFKVSVGYGGLLASLYILALHNDAKAVADSYATALNDYFGNNDLENKPVTIMIDTCMSYRSNDAGYCISPAIDLLEFGLATEPTGSITEGDSFYADYANMKTGTTRQMVEAMATESLRVHPFQTSYGWIKRSNDASTKQIYRLLDRNGEGYYDNKSLSQTAIGRTHGVWGLGKLIWTGKNGPYWTNNKRTGYLDFLYLNYDGGIDGYMLIGNQMSNPSPRVSYNVNDSLMTTDDPCIDVVEIKNDAQITVTVGASSDFMSFISSLPEDTDIIVESRVTRSEYLNTLTGTPVEVKTGGYASDGGAVDPEMALLQGQIDDIYTPLGFVAQAQTTKTIKDETLSQHEPVQKELNGNKLLIWKYDVDIRLKVNEEVWEFKAANIVKKSGTVPLNTAQVTIPPHKEPANFCEDIVIPKPSSPTTTEIVDPSKDEKLEFNTRMIRRFEYTSTVGKSVAANGVADIDDANVAAFAELKSNTPLQEEFEVLAGIPSSEEIYFSVGGSEYKVAIIMQYWMNEHSRDRTYTMHFESNLCEYNNQTKEKGDSWEGIAIPSAPGATSQDADRFEHAENTSVEYDGNPNNKKYGKISVTATWTGQITNTATAVTESDSTNHGSVTVNPKCPAKVVNTEYTTAISNANSWIESMNKLSENMKWKSASDKVERSITYALSDMGDGEASTTQGDSGSDSDSYEFTSGGNVVATAEWSYSFSNPADTEAKDTKSASCSSSGDPPVHKHGSTVTAKATAQPDGPKPFTITVTYTIDPHALCGPCCEHVLPDLYDTWRQGLVYDYAKVGQIRLYLLDQGSVEGMTELVGSDRIVANIVSGNPTYFMNIAQMTEQKNPFYTVRNGDGLKNTNNLYDGSQEAFEGKGQGNGMTFYGSSDGVYQGVNGNYNRWEAQSSRAGRLRYVLDPTQTDNPSFNYTAKSDGQGVSTTFVLDRKKVANSQQHDDVIYHITENGGRRSMACDGMGTTGNHGKNSSENASPMDTTGHVNAWATGCLYTNILNNTDYSGYHENGGIGYTYDPKELKENDANVPNYYEDYNHHIVRDGGADKTGYSDKADTKDTQTPEWQMFDAGRRTRIIVDVISDFLIMQTSGGDQSIFYFEKVSPATEAQEHFQKVKATQQEMFTDNPLSVFKAYDGECANICNDGDGNSTIKPDIRGFEIIGGYNGRYDVPSKKYLPYSNVTKEFLSFYGSHWSKYTATYREGNWTSIPGGNYNPHGETEIITVFDKDPAGTISRPERQATSQKESFKIMQDNIQILPTAPNKFYQPENAMVWYSQVAALYSPDIGAMDMEMPQNGLWVGAAKQVDLGWAQRGKYGKDWLTQWGNSIGLEISTKYYLTEDGDSNTSTINGVIVYTPVSTEKALVLPQGDLDITSVTGKVNTVSRDQRVNGFDYPDMNELVNQLKVCSLDPATCEYRYLDCKYLHETVLASFNFEPKYMGTEVDLSGNYPQNLKPIEKDNTFESNGKWITTNLITGIQYELPAGYTRQSGGFGDGYYLSATGTTAWSIPFSDLGLSSTKNNRVKVSMNLKVNSTSDNVMVAGFKNIGFIITPSGSSQFISPDEKKVNMVGTSKEMATGVTRAVKLEIVFGFNNIVDCTAYVDGIEANVTAVKDYRTVWTTTTNDQGFETRKQVTDMVTLKPEDLENNPPADFKTGDIAGYLNIGTWNNVNSKYQANYYIDNLDIILMGGTTEHNSACYTTKTVHTSRKIHVCDDKCYLDQDVYNCDGVLNDDYQLGCGKEEGIPTVTVNTHVDFSYLGSVQEVTLTPGTYKLEVWGAEGGSFNYHSNAAAGKGGYSAGTFTVSSTTKLYVAVGGSGTDNAWQGVGGWNGGGTGSAPGGGATHIATKSGTLSSLSGDTSSILIVAGGGAGSCGRYAGGAGGSAITAATAGTQGCGTSGKAGTISGGGSSGSCGTAGTFGQGGSNTCTGGGTDSGSGGGGGYYGGGAGGHDHASPQADDSSGGGGAGYANSKLTAVTGETGTRSGDGLARITVISGGTITTEDFNSAEVGTPQRYEYSGNYQTITLEPGRYIVELYGAKGGDNGQGNTGSNGTYVKDELIITQRTTAYLYVGGKGKVGNNTAGGFNGGGQAGGCDCGSGSGGGATDIRIGGTALENRVIVAGGGGGAGDPGSNAYTTAKSCGTLGTGDRGHSSNDGGGGGGGYHGGYTGNTIDAGGYIGTSYAGGTEYTTDVNANGVIVTHNANSGDGYAIITPRGHVHSGIEGASYPNGCYTVPTVHTHDITVKELICNIPEGGTGLAEDYGYKGSSQNITLQPGVYLFEVWGAGGGSYQLAAAPGGYAKGEYTLTTAQQVTINVGGAGANGNAAAGGWNGGATGATHSGGGGGKTDIAVGGTIVIAGGGGGAGGHNTSNTTAANGGNTLAAYGSGGGSAGCDSRSTGGASYIGGVSNGSHTAGGGSAAGTNGKARITNLDHQHVESCYKTTNTTCPKIEAGAYVCTGELNTVTDLNVHIHNQSCLTDYKDLTPTNFFYTGDMQTYKVPYTDYYKVEVYGAGNSTVGYASGVVKLKAGTNMYVYVGGTDGYNNFASDVRFVKYSTVATTGGYDVEVEINDKANEASLASRLMTAGATKDSAETFTVGDYVLTDVVTKGMGGSGTGRVVFTPLNRLPMQNGQKTILNQILDGDIPETQAQKYLGKELADVIINKAQVFKTWSNFSWTNYQGFVKDSNLISFANSKIISRIANGVGGWEFHVPVNIEAKSLRQVRITLDNNTNTTTIGVGINGGQKEVTTSVDAKKAGQVITIPVSDKWWDDNITSLYFDLYPGTPNETGTIEVSKIELIGHANLSATGSGYGYTELKTINNFSTSDTKGFTVRNNATISYNGSNMRVTATGSDPITDWNTIDSIAADAVKAIKIVFTNNSGADTHGQLFYKSASLGETEDNSFLWNIGATASEQTVWIDTVNKTAYNATTGSWYTKGAQTWSGNITGMRFDWGALASGSIDVKSITFIGNGSATGTGSYQYTSTLICGLNEGVNSYSKTFDYKGSVETVTLPSGVYKLEVWGAQGGADGSVGGLGGYSVGELTLSSATPLYIAVGGKGADSTAGGAGGYNGGGAGAGTYERGGGGGGATHIGLKSGLLTAFSSDYSSKLLIVAGGGGGTDTAGRGGVGGGTAGTHTGNGYAGTQTSGYNFGQGAPGPSYAAGGGGGFYGGGPGESGEPNNGGGGGSGYINTTKLTNASTKAGNTSFPNTAGTGNETGHSGNGYAKISGITHTHTASCYNETLSQSKVTITASTPSTTVTTAQYKNPFENKTTAQQTIFQNVDKIPEYVDGDYNPIFICKFEGFNEHDCAKCSVIRRLDCVEPHHKGFLYDKDGNREEDDYGNPICKEHYSGANKICWSACGKDENHKNTHTEITIKHPDNTTEVLKLAEFLQIDEGFTIYFPNIGDFYGNGVLGLSSAQLTRGYGYEDNMDTTRWTREKRVKFPFDVIYAPSEKSGEEMAIYKAGSWIELYVPDEYFNFYLLVSNQELANAKVEFECEAINCGTAVGLEPKVGISYTDRIGTIYAEKLNQFITEYLDKWYDDIKDGGYIRDTAEPNEKNDANTNTGGTKAAITDFGYMDFYITKQEEDAKKLREALDYIDTQVEKDFEGTDNDYIDPHHIDGGGSDEYDGINQEVKGITYNDNKVRFDNAMRTNSLQHLHGGYKSFYLDVIGRIGNFAITDTEDFRFSNFFKVAVVSDGDTEGLNDPNNWLVEGLVKQVDDSVQNLYVGDLYDIRGNQAGVNNRWLDTYGTQSWMAGQFTGAGRDVTKPNLVAQILTGEVNNIEVLKEEQLRYGYDIYTSIVTFGSYENAQVQVVPKYYALKVTDKNLEGVPDEYNVAKGTYLPIDIYINKDGVYQPVNVFGNAGNGNPNKGDLKMNDYVFNVDWTVEGERRNYSLEEIARTNRVKEFFKEIIYDMSGFGSDEGDAGGFVDTSNLPILDIREYVTPEGATNYLGTAQYILMDAKHRTFIGSSDSYDNNAGGVAIWNSRAGKSTFDVDKGDYPDGYDISNNRPIDEIQFERGVQRWHGKLGIPSSAVFVPHGVKVDGTTLEYIMGENQDDWVIVCTAEIIAVGAVWNINYSQPWFTSMTINGQSFATCPTGGTHYPGHRQPNGSRCPDCLDPIIAVFGKTSVDDVEIIQIY